MISSFNVRYSIYIIFLANRIMDLAMNSFKNKKFDSLKDMLAKDI